MTKEIDKMILHGRASKGKTGKRKSMFQTLF